MMCLTKDKIIEYIDGETGSIESSMIRDHLLMCQKCSAEHQKLLMLENLLREPQMVEAPDIIIANVMKKVRRKMPTYTSVAAMIAMIGMLFITWVYVYLDFANNSLLQVLSHSKGTLGDIISGTIGFISTVFAYIYSVFAALDKIIYILFNFSPGINLIGITLVLISTILTYFIWNGINKFIRSSN